MKLQVAVCGTGGPISDELRKLAEALGAAVAHEGHILICGGRDGVMEAASRGASEAGGLAVGILPWSDKAEANRYCSVVIPTGIGEARNAVVVRAADVVVLVGGGAGTLAEAAFAWQFGRPIIALASSGGWAKELAGRAIDERRADVILTANTVEEVIRLIRERRSG
jgi:uncharacterized protein (TIGR00725 family)